MGRSGSRPAVVSWCRKCTTVCVRPTANAGISTLPPRSAARRQAAADVLRFPIGHGLHAQQRLIYVAAVVQRLDFRLPFLPFTVEVGGVLFLDLGGVAEHDRGEGARGRRAVDRAAEALADEVG